MSCSGRYAEATDFADFWCLDDLSAAEEASIENFLDLSATDIHAVLAASGACDCTLASWADGYLSRLNVLNAAVSYNCRCAGSPSLSDDMKRAFMGYLSEQLSLIRTGRLELCDNETSSDHPAWGSIQQSLTDFSAANITYNTLLKNRY